MDKLEQIFEMQKTLQESAYGYKFEEMQTEEQTAFIKEMSIHTIQEINELLYELPFFKPWKDYYGMSLDDILNANAKAKKEYVDVLHFFVNIGLALGFTAEELAEEYINKNKENYQRQAEGYTHDKSYRS